MTQGDEPSSRPAGSARGGCCRGLRLRRLRPLPARIPVPDRICRQRRRHGRWFRAGQQKYRSRRNGDGAVTVAALVIDAALLVLFGVQHSVMATARLQALVDPRRPAQRRTIHLRPCHQRVSDRPLRRVAPLHRRCLACDHPALASPADRRQRVGWLDGAGQYLSHRSFRSVRPASGVRAVDRSASRRA